MSLLNAVKKGFKINAMAIIGSGDIVQDILNDFVAKLQLNPNISDRLRIHFEKKYQEEMESYSGFKSALEINIPVLVIHDENDPEVSVKAGINIHNHLKNGTLFLTKGLGHRKILGNPLVIEKVVQFVNYNR
jgi:pimeloyl-ACP methyl ester carboxylesterase